MSHDYFQRSDKQQSESKVREPEADTIAETILTEVCINYRMGESIGCELFNDFNSALLFYQSHDYFLR